MARRRKNDDWVWAIPQVVGLFLALGFVYPPIHQVLWGLGFIAICVIGVAVVGLVGFGLYRFTTRSQRPQAVERNVDWKALGVNVKGETQPQPQTTTELIERLCSIDWFQFEKVVEAVYQKHGYHVTRRGGANPDGGIDLIIEREGLRTAIQCKHWKAWRVSVSYWVEVKAQMNIGLPDEDGTLGPVPIGAAGGKPEPEIDYLSNIVRQFNELFGSIDWKDTDKITDVIAHEIPAKVSADKAYQNAKQNSDKQNARIEHDRALERVITDLVLDHTELFKRFMEDPNFK